MPIYDYNCPNCGEKTDIWAKIDEIKLCDCGQVMTRLMSATRIQCDIEPYFDENLAEAQDPKKVTGQWVLSRQHRKEIMKNQGLIETG